VRLWRCRHAPVESNEADPARAVGTVPPLHAPTGTMTRSGSVLSCGASYENSIWSANHLLANLENRSPFALFYHRGSHSPARGHGRRTVRRPALTRSGVGTLTPRQHSPHSGRWAVSLAAELFIVSRCASMARSRHQPTRFPERSNGPASSSPTSRHLTRRGLPPGPIRARTSQNRAET
jgi:hypothetical protein